MPRLTAIIGSTRASPAQVMNSSRPNALVSTAARPGRGVRAARAGPDAVLPAVAGDEVAAGVAHDGHAQLARQLEDVAAEAVLVGRRVAGLVDARVDAPAHVLDERAEEAAVDLGDLVAGVGGHASGRRRPGSPTCRSGMGHINHEEMSIGFLATLQESRRGDVRRGVSSADEPAAAVAEPPVRARDRLLTHRRVASPVPTWSTR